MTLVNEANLLQKSFLSMPNYDRIGKFTNYPEKVVNL